MKGNIKYEKSNYGSNFLKVIHKDFSKLHQRMLYLAYNDKKVMKKMRGLCWLANVSYMHIVIENNKVISIDYDIEQKTKFEDIKEKDKMFWEMTPFYRVLTV